MIIHELELSVQTAIKGCEFEVGLGNRILAS